MQARNRRIESRNRPDDRYTVVAATVTGLPESDTADLEWHTCLSHGSDIDCHSVACVTESHNARKVKRLGKAEISAREQRRLLRMSRRRWSRDTVSRDLVPCDPMSQYLASGDLVHMPSSYDSPPIPSLTISTGTAEF